VGEEVRHDCDQMDIQLSSIVNKTR
jgi:hypothetical protein